MASSPWAIWQAAPYWTRETVKKFSALLAVFIGWGVSTGFCGLVESTVIRQRLPDLDSAGYYMATRFSEIATYLYSAMIFAFFPFAADLAKNSREHAKLILKTTGVNLAFCAAIALVFGLVARPLLAFLPNGEKYAAYWWAVPWLIAITGIASLHGFYTTAEVAANRFGFLKWTIPLDLAYPALILAVTGHGYFAGLMPESWSTFLKAHNIYSLETMLWWMTAINAAKAAGCLLSMPAGSLSMPAGGIDLPTDPVGSDAPPAGASKGPVGSAAPPAGAAT